VKRSALAIQGFGNELAGILKRAVSRPIRKYSVKGSNLTIERTSLLLSSKGILLTNIAGQ